MAAFASSWAKADVQLPTPLSPFGSDGIFNAMVDFIAFKFVPLAATLCVWVGGAGLVFITSMAVAVFVFGKPVRDAETGEVVPPAKSAKTFSMLGGAYLLAVAAGLMMKGVIENAEQDPSPILWIVGLSSLFGAFLAVCLLWHQLRRRS